MTMSWKDPRTGIWHGGPPPGGVPQHRPTEHAFFATIEVDVSGEPRGLSLAEAQERRRRRHAGQEAAWLTEAKVCETLGLSADALYRDAELIGAAAAING